MARAGELVRRRLKPLIVAAAAGAAWLAVVLGGPLTPVDGLLFDAGVLLRWGLAGEPPPAAGHVAVLAIDRSTLAAPEVKALPRALFSPVWGRVLDAAAAAGASAVTFDAIFEFSGNAVIPNHDRDFLAALARHKARAVIARTGDSLPALPFMFAIGGRSDPMAVALSELVPGLDGVVREARPFFPGPSGEKFPTLSAAALARSGQVPPGEPVLYPVAQPLELAVPTYPLIDVLRCAGSDEGRALLAERLGGRAVFVGTTLPEEDRKIAPDRLLLPFVAASDAPVRSEQAGECILNRLGVSAPRSGTIPGVHVHAAVVEAVRGGQQVRLAPTWGAALLAATAAGLAAWAGLALSPLRAAAAGLGIGLVVLASSWGLAPAGLWLPAGPPIVAAVLAAMLAFAARYWFEDRRRAHLQRIFGHYLAPVIVERLAASEEGVRLEGETRDVTVMFADLSGFTALSGRLQPAELMEITNLYLGVIVEAVDATGGYVDKFIGDAVMALWNAPAECAGHAGAAIAAATQAAAGIDALRRTAEAAGGPAFSVKIGLNSGPAVAGNVGAASRFSYTAVGETVNIASRLEPLPALYGCAVVVSGETARRAADWLSVEIDWVTVKGREALVEVMVPLAPRTPETEADHAAFLAGWADALAAYRRGDFAQAARGWRSLPPPPAWDGRFGPAEVMAKRAEHLAHSSPDTWTGIWAVAKG